MGLCGEKCPNLCRICKPEDPAFEILFGDEDEPDSRFIELECKHIIESRGLDTFMDAVDEPNSKKATSIQFKSCPMCKSPIRKILRYSNIIKSTLADVTRVKEKILESAQAKSEALAANRTKLLGEISKATSMRHTSTVSVGLSKLRERLHDPLLKMETLELVAEKVSVAVLFSNLKAGENRVKAPFLQPYKILVHTLEKFFVYSQRDESKVFAKWFEDMKAQKKSLVGDDGISDEERIEIVKAMGFSQVDFSLSLSLLLACFSELISHQTMILGPLVQVSSRPHLCHRGVWRGHARIEMQ